MNDSVYSKALACKSAEELVSLAAEEGLTLSQEQAEELMAKLQGDADLSEEELEAIAGGCGGGGDGCLCRAHHGCPGRKKKKYFGTLPARPSWIQS